MLSTLVIKAFSYVLHDVFLQIWIRNASISIVVCLFNDLTVAPSMFFYAVLPWLVEVGTLIGVIETAEEAVEAMAASEAPP